MNTNVRAKLAQVPGARAIVKGFRNLRERIFMPLRQTTNEHEAMLKILADTNFRMRAIMKHAQNKPINVLFVCHEPALWSMFESIYEVMENDSAFCPMVVALPYRHPTLPNGQYKDAGMYEYCKSKNINAIQGLNKETNEWLNPASLLPDYVFFQTPYRLLTPVWSVEKISMMAKVCYVPYGGCIYAGEVDEIVNPINFFKHASIIFKENLQTKNNFVQKFAGNAWFNHQTVLLSGCTKLDFLYSNCNYQRILWRRGLQNHIKRILWTPRWHTEEGNCHFFDYKQFFLDFCSLHQEVDFIFRPHPLSLQNFIKTGELSQSDLDQLEIAYEQSTNMVIDKGGGYEDTFSTSDILISDMSTILFEYFATGKPIIYTHRVDHFNELGKKISEGFYWVKNAVELKATLEMLLTGEDPLMNKRTELKKMLYFIPDGGVGRFIKQTLKDDYDKYLK